MRRASLHRAVEVAAGIAGYLLGRPDLYHYCYYHHGDGLCWNCRSVSLEDLLPQVSTSSKLKTITLGEPMPSPAEIAYNDLIRGLNGQATDLESIRSHVNIALTAGGISAAIFANKAAGSIAIDVALGAFAVIAIVVGFLYWSVRAFKYDLVATNILSTYAGRTSDEVFEGLVRTGQRDIGQIVRNSTAVGGRTT